MSENVKKTFANFDPGLILVLLLLTFAVYPLLRSGLPSMADVPIHLYRTMEMVRCWQDRVYYPRWAPNLAFGYGYPLFNFAPPLPSFIAGLFHVLGADFETAIKLLAVLCFLLYGLGMYLFAREVLGAKPALLAAAAYVYTPFRFREALIYGGNYPQILAMAFYPWVLWAFYRIIVLGRSRYVIVGALAYACLILSHNFHSFIFTPLLVAYILCLMVVTKKLCPEQRRRVVEGWVRAGEVGLALALGLGLSAFFWVPALYDMRWAMVREEYYLIHTDFHQRFLSFRDLVAWPVPLDASADNPYLPFSLGPAILVLAAISLAALAVGAGYQVWRRWIPPNHPTTQPPNHLTTQIDTSVKWHLLFFAFVLVASVLIMLPASTPIWENAPFLPIGQFPWRVMGVAELSLAFLAGASLCFWSDRGVISKAFLALMVSVVIVVFSVAVYFYPTTPFVEYDNPSLQDYFRFELSTQTMGATAYGEYTPVWAKAIPTTSPLMPAYLAGLSVEKLNREALPGSVQAQLVEHTVISDRYRFVSDEPFTAHFYTFYFPAWRAYLDGTNDRSSGLAPIGQPTEIQITDPFALIAVPVTAGEHELLLRFESLPLWTAVNTLSAVVLLAVLAVWVLSPLRRLRIALATGQFPADEDASSLKVAAKPSQGSLPPEQIPGAFSRNQALLLGGVVLLLFLVKVLIVDPHTAWFRRRSPVGQVVGVQHPARVNLDDKVLFLGYDLVSGDTVRQGEDLHVRLYWLALQPFDPSTGSGHRSLRTQPLDVNYSSFLHLDAAPDYATWATSDNRHPGDPQAQIAIPTSGWWTSLYVRDEHRLKVPPDIPPVQYLLRVGLYDRRTGKRLKMLADDGSATDDSITLQPLHVRRAKPISLRGLPYRSQVAFGGWIELLGYDLEIGNLESGIEDFELTLYWRAKVVVENDYTVFVHLMDQGGKLWGQGDSVPVGGMYPTSAWLPGQLVEDRHVIQIAPARGEPVLSKVEGPVESTVPPGSYRLLVGLYDPATMERLEAVGPEGPLPEGAVNLTELRIGN